MGTNETNRILYFDASLNSPDGRVRDRIGYIKDESEIASTFKEENSDTRFISYKPVVVFDKKLGLFSHIQVTPDSEDVDTVPVNIDTSRFYTFIDRVVLVPYNVEGLDFIQFRFFVTTEGPDSPYRIILELNRLMEYIGRNEKMLKRQESAN